MKGNRVKGILAISFFALLLILNSCAGVKFNQTTVSNVELAKQKIYKLLDKGTTDYAANSAEIKQLNDAIQSDIAFENGRGKTNVATVNMWKQVSLLLNNNILKEWDDQKKLGQTYIDDQKKRIDKILGYITELEQYKKGGSLDK